MMRRSVAFGLTTVVLWTVFIDPASAQTPVRDAVRSSSVGTAGIAGTVVSDDKDRRPLRRARVLLTTGEHESGRMVITDDAGRYAFTGLAPAHYRLSANKPGYVNVEYGARRSERPGIEIVVAEGQRLTNVVLRLPRGAVIAGTVLDQNGQPLAGASVRPSRYQFAENGRRTLRPVQHFGTTNDVGEYRIWGLDAGEYVLAAYLDAPAESELQGVIRLTEADIKQAEAEADGLATRASASPRRVSYAPVYYPGTFARSEAASIRLAAGEERSGIDVRLSLIATAEVDGTVVVPDGVERHNLSVQLVRTGAEDAGLQTSVMSAHVGDDSRFSFSGVAPGQYTLTARTEDRIEGRSDGGITFSGRSPGAAAHWAMEAVTVNGEDISGISLVLQPTFTVSGKVKIESSGSSPDLSRLLVLLGSEGNNNLSGAPPAVVDANGTFTIVGVTAGRYRFDAGLLTMRSADDVWQVKSVVVNGRETVDDPIELATSVDGVVLTVTNRMPAVSGIVRDASGQPAPDCHVVIFPKERRFWIAASDRVMSVRPASDGRYQIRAIRAGEHFAIAVADLEPGEWFDPTVLEQLSKSALTMTLVENEKTVQDLRLGERR